MKKTFFLVLSVIAFILLIVFRSLFSKQLSNNKTQNKNIDFEVYLGKQITGNEVTTIINKAINENENNHINKDENGYYIENEENSIKITIKMTSVGKDYIMEEFYKNDITKFVKNFSIIKFECSKIEYHEKTGNIKRIIITEL